MPESTDEKAWDPAAESGQPARGERARSCRGLLLRLLDEGLAAVGGRRSVRRALQARGVDAPVILIAVGKAAQAMTEGAWDVLGDQIRGGLVISKPGHLIPERLARFSVEGIEAGHPLPTEGSLAAGRRLLALLETSGAASLLFLISGGASSLVEVPISGLGLPQLVRLNQWLLGSGLPIHVANRIRTSVSRIKGGGLLAVVGQRRVRALAISDVPGDDLSVIGSGLLVPAPDLAPRLAALHLPDWLQQWTNRGLKERIGIPASGPEIELVATLDVAKDRVAAVAEAAGCAVYLHRQFLAGDAAERGRDVARRLIKGPSGLHVWGGETTVRLPPSPGRGGRNQHLALAAAVELAGRDDCFLLSAGTDGTDGTTEDAGALVDGGTLERGERAGLHASSALAAAGAGSFLAASGDLVHTGPTGTNVMDLILGLRL